MFPDLSYSNPKVRHTVHNSPYMTTGLRNDCGKCKVFSVNRWGIRLPVIGKEEKREVLKLYLIRHLLSMTDHHR